MAEAISEIWEEAPRGVAGDGTILALDGLTRMRAAVAGRMATSDLSLNFVRPVCVRSGAIVARARVTYAGRSLGLLRRPGRRPFR